MIGDLRFAWRALWKSPTTTLGAMLALALGIGATTTMFGLLNAVSLRPLPYPEAERLVELWGNVERQVVDVFYDGREFVEFADAAHPNEKSHGSGCTFSAAITAGLANRLELIPAIDQAKQLVTMAIQYSDGQGRGVAPVNVLAFAPKKSAK